MRSVGLQVLKNKLSEYVRLVEGGEVVLVTDRDREVAELRPPTERAPMVADALMADLVRRGVLTPPLMVREGPPPRLPVPIRTLDALHLATLLFLVAQGRQRRVARR